MSANIGPIHFQSDGENARLGREGAPERRAGNAGGATYLIFSALPQLLAVILHDSANPLLLPSSANTEQ